MPENSEEEKLAVLPLIKHGRPCRSRTCDTLIKRNGDNNKFCPHLKMPESRHDNGSLTMLPS